MGTYQIRFLLSSYYLSFIFLTCVSFVLSFCLPSIIAHSLFELCKNASTPFTAFLLLHLAHVAKGGPKTGVVDFLWWSSLGQGLSVA